MVTRPEVRVPLPLDSLENLQRLTEEALAQARAGEHGQKRHEENEEGPARLLFLQHQLRLWSWPDDRADWGALKRAAQHREDMQQQEAPLPGALGSWQYIGPKRWKATFTGGDYASGRINHIAIDPTDNKILYASSAGGGVWKTTDGGVTWTPLSDRWRFLATSCVAVDPKNPSTIYAGTGDFPAWSSRTLGVMKSTDGGATFTNIPAGVVAEMNVSSIIVDPDDSRIVTLCGGRGPRKNGVDFRFGRIWRSTDSGATWTAVSNVEAEWAKLAISIPDSRGERTMFATGFANNVGHLLRSVDRGASWTELAVPWGGAQFGTSVATSLLDPRRLYVLAGGTMKVYTSADNGDTWSDITGNLRQDGGEWQQLWYDWDLACGSSGGASPHDVLFLGLIHLNYWDSVQRTWTGIAHGHDDVHCITVDPKNPNHIWIGNDGGVFEGIRDSMGNWSTISRSENLGVTQAFRGHASLHDPRIAIAGTQDNAVATSQTDPSQWGQLLPPTGGDAITGYVSPTNPKLQFNQSGVAFWGIARTADQWATSAAIEPDIEGKDIIWAYSMPLAMNETGSRLFWATDYLWIREESTQKWTPRIAGQQLAANKAVVECLGLSATDPNRVYTGSQDRQVWMFTSLGGAAPVRIDNNGLPMRTITSISVHPANPDDVLVTVSGTGHGHVFRCRNTQASTPLWEDVSGSGATGLPDLPAMSVVRDPRDPSSAFFVAMDSGVFATADAGATWSDIAGTNGLPNVQLNHMKLVGRTLYVFTLGRGIWRLRLPMTTVTPASASISDTLFVASTSIDGRVLLCKAKYGQAFSAWHQITGNGRTDSPVALASFDNTLFAVARGRDNQVVVNQADLTTSNGDIDKFAQSFSGWFPIPGGFTTDAAPAAVRVGPSLFVFIKSPDGRIFFNQAEYRKSFAGWFEMPGGGRTSTAPACATVNGNVVFVFIRSNDGRILVNQAVFGGSFSGWFEVPGGAVATTAPAACAVGSTVYVFTRNSSGQVIFNRANYGGAFAGWSPIAGTTTAIAPGASSVGQVVFSFVVDANSQIRAAQGPGGTFSAWFAMPDDAP